LTNNGRWPTAAADARDSLGLASAQTSQTTFRSIPGTAIGAHGLMMTPLPFPARPHFEESLERFRDLGDGHYILLAGNALGWVLDHLGDREARRKILEQTLREARAQRDWAVVAMDLDELAFFARDEGRFDEALSMLTEALRLKRELDMPSAIVESLCRFARLLAACGATEKAARLLGATQALRQDIGGFSWVADENEVTLSELGTQLDEAALGEALEQGRKLTLDEAVALALGQQPSSARP